jgi:hypothetical protein
MIPDDCKKMQIAITSSRNPALQFSLTRKYWNGNRQQYILDLLEHRITSPVVQSVLKIQRDKIFEWTAPTKSRGFGHSHLTTLIIIPKTPRRFPVHIIPWQVILSVIVSIEKVISSLLQKFLDSSSLLVSQ